MEKIKKLLNKYQIFVWSAVSSLTIIVLVLLVIIPQSIELFKVFALLTTTSKQLNALTTKLSQLNQVDEGGVKTDLTTALSVLPAEKDLVSSLSQVQLLATADNLKIDDLSFAVSPPSANDKNNGFTVKLSLQGSIDQIKNFL